VLAAGQGRRFGGGSKPLAMRHGRTLLSRAIGTARAAPAARLIVVVGRQGERVARAARAADRRVVIVRATHWRDGPGASLAAGVCALWPVERRAFVFLADMPAVPPGLARRLVRIAGAAGARPVNRGGPGHPVLLGPVGLVEAAAGRTMKGRGGMATLVADRRCRIDIDRRSGLRVAAPALG
jgi:CTP:molybdopterin cytidylyltransferase MocA